MQAANSLFPLPMAAFERYMLADDRPDYPMVFVLTLQLAGQIDRAALERSLCDALGRHPLLHALVDRTIRRRPCWVSAGDRPPQLDWDVEGVPLRCVGGADGVAIDLTSRPGLRVWVRQGGQGAELSLQFHHACCDGLGALRFIGDVLSAYGIHVAGGHDKPVPRPVDVGRLATRGKLGRGKLGRGNLGRGDESTLERTLAFLGNLSHMLRFVARRPVPLSSPADLPPAEPVLSDRTETQTLPSIEHHAFSEVQTQRLRDVAARHGTTLNDLLMRDMFLTINQWNSLAHGQQSGRQRGRQSGWLRVSMPTNLRRPDDEQMPASNFVSHTFLTRRPRAMRNPQKLLAGIQRETAAIKRTRRGLCFIRVIEAAQALCGDMPRLLVGSRCRATTVLSNLGHIERSLAATFPQNAGRIVAGNLTLKSITAAPPIRPNTSAAFLAYCYAGRLNIGALFDQKIFTRAQAQTLLNKYTNRLLDTAANEG